MHANALFLALSLQIIANHNDIKSKAFDPANIHSAELLVVPDTVETVIPITPDDIGGYACKLKVSKESSQWNSFKHIIEDFPPSYGPSSGNAEVRVGVIFRDDKGKIIRAIFAQNPRMWKSDPLAGFVDGKAHSIPRTVAESLRRFATDHRELANTPDKRTSQLCNALS